MGVFRGLCSMYYYSVDFDPRLESELERLYALRLTL
uniref:Uncharacterized protein n=1 Tax=Arundo donax TaxID=35708 RepID=A0A0A9CRF4_ARUDO